MKRQYFDDKRSSSIHSFTNPNVSMVLSWQHRDAISLGFHRGGGGGLASLDRIYIHISPISIEHYL